MTFIIPVNIDEENAAIAPIVSQSPSVPLAKTMPNNKKKKNNLSINKKKKNKNKKRTSNNRHH
jgi:hypothetical protein